MKKLILILLFAILPFQSAKADIWGADLPLLAEIVFNTLHTMVELEKQSQHMNDELAGIKDRIYRVRTIADLVQPSEWNKWKDPKEALNRLRIVYHTIPKEYRSEKYDNIEYEISRAMNLVSLVRPETATTFKSGKEMERKGADASPGVAQKLTASGVGTLISIESQSQVIQSHITSLLAQMLAEGNEKETRAVSTKGSSFKSFATNLSQREARFSEVVFSGRRNP
ncbi:MAG: hypothetical protein IPM97_05510 [Bdellovibrionaceae bacterium]|nr:hypothetical protein [Pseudobdellovibrionaceae bacterium]